MEHTAHILTLDVGTTSIKAALFDGQGRLCATGSCEYQPDKPRADWMELDPEVYWQAACQGIRSALAACGGGRVEIRAVGVTSQGETLIVLDGQGRPLRPAIVWLDTRSAAEAAELAEAFDPAEVYRVTGQQEMIPAWPATRVMWLRRHEPEIYARAARYLLVGDYLVYRLTGRLASDRGLNPSTLYFDLNTGGWWPAMLEYLGLRPEQLPELTGPAAAAGRVHAEAARAAGLPAGIPVVPGPIDQVCGAIGAGSIAPGVITENTGAALALAATTLHPVLDSRRRVGLYLHGVPGRYMLLPWAPTAGMALRWFRDEFGGGADYEALCRPAADIAPGAGGLILLPHFSGAGCPRVSPRARASLHGLTLAHTRAHIVRALMEAVAFMVRGNLEMLAEMGVPGAELRSLGGAARSGTWLQIKADVCRRDLVAMECSEATSLGLALLAAVAVGMHADHAAACAAMIRAGRVVRHDPAAADLYEPVYRRYCDLERRALQECEGAPPTGS